MSDGAARAVDETPPESWAEIDKDLVKKVSRQAELQIQSQAQTAQSLDQRATSIAALANGGAVAIVIFVVTKQVAPEGIPEPILWGILAIAAAWFASALCALAALRPGPRLSAGTWPHQWYGFLRGRAWKQEELLGSVVEQLEENCRKNHARNRKAGRALKAAIWLAILGPVLGAISFWAGPKAWGAVVTVAEVASALPY